jgi:hypothetical protein
VPQADYALNALMEHGDIYQVGRRHFLVAPLNAELVETLIIAAGATEDDEDNDDAEAGDNDDLGIDDMPMDEPQQDMEPSLCGINAGDQPGINSGDREGDPCDLGEPDHDNEPSLCGVMGTGAAHMDPGDREVEHRSEVDHVIIAAARARYQGKRRPMEAHPDGQVYRVTYDSGCKILTRISGPGEKGDLVGRFVPVGGAK